MKRFMLLGLCALVGLWPSVSIAQSRLEKSVGSSGVTIHDPGDRSQSGFRGNSYGLRGPSYGSPTNSVLGNNGPSPGLMGTGLYDDNALRRFTLNTGRSATGMPSALPTLKAANQMYQAITSDFQNESGETALGALLKRRSNLWSANIEAGDGRLAAKQDGMISSLVPEGEGLYHDYMQDGEKAFREGDYLRAFNKFRLANYIGQKDPESLLSMSHVQFAAKCYPLAAYYLRQTVRYMPRLPMLPLRPKSFYSNASLYVQYIQELDDQMAARPFDADLLLLRAYYAWFDSDELYPERTAQACLEKALATDPTPSMTLSIEQLWEGMVASGKVKGTLVRATAKPAEPSRK